MVCDIHTEIDLKQNGIWKTDVEVSTFFKPFPFRDYNLFDFLANVRSSGSPAIAAKRGLTPDRQARVDAYFEEMNNGEPRWGGWDDAPCQFNGCHSISWVLLSELVEYDYDKTFVIAETQRKISFREYLGKGYFENIEKIINRYPKFKQDEIRIFFLFRQLV